MKIALLGSAPSSLGLAPIGRPDWQVWGCSPGVYYQCGSPNAWFELHRWEPPVIGNATQQKQWFSPEYVLWMAQRRPDVCPVWMYEAVPEIPASRALPVDILTKRYGTFFFTSSLAWMIACAIEDILEDREKRTTPIQDEIALYGVDMAANEEYGYQRAGCQHFLLIAADLGIKVTVPPESDLLRPMPLYGIDESSHWAIKFTIRKQEHQQRIAASHQQIEVGKRNLAFMEGALDELNYQMQTWGGDRVGMGVDPRLVALMPRVRENVLPPIQAQPKFGEARIKAPPEPAGDKTDAIKGVGLPKNWTRKKAKRKH